MRCRFCGRSVHAVRDGLMWEDDYGQMVCPGTVGGQHEPYDPQDPEELAYQAWRAQGYWV